MKRSHPTAKDPRPSALWRRLRHVLSVAPGLLALAVAFPLSLRADPVHRFDQPAMPLVRALNRLGEKAGISVLIEGSGAGLTAPALHGEMSLDAALGQVLALSGAGYGFTSNGSLTVTLPGTPPQGQTAPEISLGTIVLTATGQPQQLTDAPATMTVIQGEELRARRATSVADALRGLPGLSVSGPGREGLPAITLRGMGQSYLLFLVDGRPLSASEEASYNGQGSNSKIGFLPPPGAVERIEIIRGPMSALYGSAASGGVINVITREIPLTWGGEVALDFAPGMRRGGGGHGKADSHGLRFYLGGPLVQNRLALSLYGSENQRGEDDLAQADYLGQGFGASERSTWGARLALSMDDSQSLSLDLQQSRQEFHRTALSARSPARTAITDRRAALTHRIAWSATARTESFLQWQATDFHSGNDSGHDALTFNSRTTLQPGANIYTIGYEYRAERTRHDPDRLPGTADPALRRWHQSLFFEGGFALDENVTLTLGLRADQNEKYGFALTPRAYLVWHLNPQLTLKGGIGNGYRTPPLKQADDGVAEPSGGDGRSRDLGNSSLRPERSTNYELGLIWSGERGAQVGATLFHSRFTDRISRSDLCRTPSGQAPGCWYQGEAYVAITQYVNEDSARMRGLELTFDLPLGAWDLSASYTWSASRVTRGRNAGQSFHTMPRHMLNLALAWQSEGAPGFWVNARGESRVAASGRNVAEPSHLVVDLGLTWDFNPKVTGALALYNVTNWQPANGYDEGRQLWLGLSARF